MRIISGKFKGKTLLFIKSKYTRPLKDSVKENIFNILSHSKDINLSIENAEVLDMYSGIGSFGLECISREAKNVTFIEKDSEIVKTLTKNLENLKNSNNASIINSDIKDFISNEKNKKYDIFFLDPPFVEKDFVEILKILKKNNNYKKKHIIIIHREKKTEDNFTNFFKTLKIKLYAKSKIIFGRFS